MTEIFPGLFRYEQFLVMDMRDLSFWMYMAEMVHLGRHIERIEEARLAFADNNTYRRAVEPLKMELARLRAWKSQQEVWDENWKDLRQGR